MAYSLSNYSAMLADDARAGAYVAALERVLRPGMTVLDLGAGSGFLSFEACRLGARRVFAIEPNDAIHAARATAAANGLAERIVFFPHRSDEIQLPERADVIVADLRGVLPFYDASVRTLIDARERFLAPGGTLIPHRDVLHTAVVAAEDLHRRALEPWGGRETSYDSGTLLRLLENTWRCEKSLSAEQHVTDEGTWATIDYHTTTTPHVAGTARLRASRSCAGHGLRVWFAAELVDGIGFTSGASPESAYGSAFFPWPHTVDLVTDDVVEAALRADLVGSAYVWRWTTRVHGAAGNVKASFAQSTFFGAPLSVEELRRHAPDHRPRASEALQIDRFILSLFGQNRSLAEIAQAVAREFPQRFDATRDALAHVASLSAHYRT